MKFEAEVIKVYPHKVIVRALIKNACISCSNTGCATPSTPFATKNPKNLMLISGTKVYVEGKKRDQIMQALVSVVLPIAIAIIFWKITAHKSESFRSILVVCNIFVVSALVLLLRRIFPPTYATITDTAEKTVFKSI